MLVLNWMKTGDITDHLVMALRVCATVISVKKLTGLKHFHLHKILRSINVIQVCLHCYLLFQALAAELLW